MNMNYLQNISDNTQISLWSALIGGVASYSMYDYGLYEIPYVDYEVPNYLVYGAMIGLSSFWLKMTGDFVLPLISSNPQISSLSKLSIPLSVGIISVGTLFLFNGFQIPSMDQATKMIILSGGSYIVADWLYNRVKLMMSKNAIEKNSTENVKPLNSIYNI